MHVDVEFEQASVVLNRDLNDDGGDAGILIHSDNRATRDDWT